MPEKPAPQPNSASRGAGAPSPTERGRRAFRSYLAKRGVDAQWLAAELDLPDSHISRAVNNPRPDFQDFRTRLRIERHAGELFWTSPAESAALVEAGAKLGLDLFTASKVEMQAAIAKLSQGRVKVSCAVSGLVHLRAALELIFPGTDIVNAPHYRSEIR